VPDAHTYFELMS